MMKSKGRPKSLLTNLTTPLHFNIIIDMADDATDDKSRSVSPRQDIYYHPAVVRPVRFYNSIIWTNIRTYQ